MAIIPIGLCQCGCNQAAPIAQRNDSIHNMVRGQPLRYIKGHQPNGGWKKKRKTNQSGIVEEIYIGSFLDCMEPDPGQSWGYFLRSEIKMIMVDRNVLSVFDHIWRIYGATPAIRYAQLWPIL